jgi:hypothetical protein
MFRLRAGIRPCAETDLELFSDGAMARNIEAGTRFGCTRCRAVPGAWVHAAEMSDRGLAVRDA